MIRAINLTKELRFVSEDDPGKGTPDETVFFLKPLTSGQLGAVNDLIASFDADALRTGNSEGSSMKIHQAAILAAQLGLTGWENFEREDGSPVEFVTERKTVAGKAGQYVRGDLLDLIPLGACFGMYRLLSETAQPTEQDVGNLKAA